MAEDNGKRVKIEEPEGTEAINSLNEEDAEKKLVEEAQGNAASRPDDAIPSKEDQKDGIDIVNIDDYDAEPKPLQADTETGELFPGVPCTTVAKRCKKGNDDPAPQFLNRYGPRAVGWFVWSTSPANLAGRSTDDLQNVSEKFHRVLDQPLEQGKPRYRASDVSGIMNLVWDCEGFENSPMEAAELLNPNKVKKADVLETDKARRQWLKEKKKNSLDKYPITHVDVKFYKRINDTVPRLKDKEVNFLSNWETGSQYRSLYRKDQIKAERRIYEAAKWQAQRFNHWYENTLPQEYAKHRRSLSRDPTVQQFKRSEESASPAYSDESPAPTVKTEPGSTETNARGDEKTGSRTIASKPQQDQSQKTSSQTPATDDDELSEAEQEEAALEGWCAAKGITPSNITGKDRRRFDIYYDVWRKNQ